MTATPEIYQAKHPIRVVTAASLFDGHDAAINIMRRILQSSGAEVIHLGHNRSVAEIVDCAIAEDAQAIAITSYQGGHVEYFKYMYDLLKEKNAAIKIFGGGGGTILPEEIAELHAYGIERIYSPDDGRQMGLQGMINDLLSRSDFATVQVADAERFLPKIKDKEPQSLARLITLAENAPDYRETLSQLLRSQKSGRKVPVLGITGTGGAGKSSLVDELVRRFLFDFSEASIAVISVDPSKRKSGGALLGDRIRMNAIHHPRAYMRSLATRQSNLALSRYVQDSIDLCQAAGFDLVIVETSGIGQSDTEITEHSDMSLYVMTSEYGAATQLEKIDMLDFADVIAINKFDKSGSLDALRDVRKQYRRNHQAWEMPEDELPVVGTIASQFNDPGMDRLYLKVMRTLQDKTGVKFQGRMQASEHRQKQSIIPPKRVRYLAEICEASDRYETYVQSQTQMARELYQIYGTIQALRQGEQQQSFSLASPQQINQLDLDFQNEIAAQDRDSELISSLRQAYQQRIDRLDAGCRGQLLNWPQIRHKFEQDVFEFQVRDRTIRLNLFSESLSHLKIPKIALPRYRDWGDILEWLLRENIPGEFPYTAGVFPLKREGEDPARMFAGEGGPERTNKRFHYLSYGMPAKRLSTAFDSVTLYGEDPDYRPDIYGKVGNSGVSIANLDDAKKLYSGFNLADPKTSVSMTINGPAPMLLGFFINAAIDQQCEIHIHKQGIEADVQRKIEEKYRKVGLPRPLYQGDLPKGHDGLGLMLLGVSGDEVLPKETYEAIKIDTMKQIRGTVQADILKEDQAQNTCIFSTEFALRMMGDMQQYFIDHQVRNFYSVSISGYHIAEAGANPITQVAFTLANGFTYVEYYLSRGMHIDDFAANLSFFFSNGLDPEYSVIGRVARRLWAKAIKHNYGGNERSQKLKYHIQTSGRSLHAQEIAFNDIRTTLQALYALNDNCNSLHTNAYDEAITTPTEESVRRAMAIQLIINKELGLAKNENPLQGAFIIEKLTDMVEAAVLEEFRRISDRGGVLGAMERMYQRSKIQDESMHYESMKHSGQLPLIGVNTFLDSKGSPTLVPEEVIRATQEEKEYAIQSRNAFMERNSQVSDQTLEELRKTALNDGNTFATLMEVCKVCTLGQISRQLYEVGGQYRRNM
ncbi:MAG: methylmalonyl-CoA mutase family protein [Oligoflexus sp.]